MADVLSQAEVNALLKAVSGDSLSDDVITVEHHIEDTGELFEDKFVFRDGNYSEFLVSKIYKKGEWEDDGYIDLIKIMIPATMPSECLDKDDATERWNKLQNMGYVATKIDRRML